MGTSQSQGQGGRTCESAWVGQPADCLTKHVDRAMTIEILKLLGMRVMEGRSGAAPELPPDPTLTPADSTTL